MGDVNGTMSPAQARIRAAREKLTTIEKARVAVLEEREAVMLETRLKYEEELGPGGEAFQLLDANEHGPIVLAPPASGGIAVLHKAFLKSIDAEKARAGSPHGDGITPEACQRFVMPCLLTPDREAFGDMIERAPGLLFSCAAALADLCNARAKVDQGK